MADVDRDMHDPGKNYAYGVTQKGKEIVPGDENDSKASLLGYMKDAIVTLNLTGFAGTGFRLSASPTDMAHDFYVGEGLGFSGDGVRCYLDATVSWILPSYASVAQRALHSVVNQVGATGVQDAAMEFPVNSLVGRNLRVQRKADGVVLTYAVLSNTADFIETAGNPSFDGVTAGCSYCVLPETVTVDRTDLVCLNTWEGEANYLEDADLLHPLIGNAEAMARRKMRNVVTVITDVDPADPLASLPADYVDAYGDTHKYMPVGVLTRHAGDDTIAGGDIADERVDLKDLAKFLLLDCTNGPLTGPLTFQGLVTAEAGIEMDDSVLHGDFASIDFNTGIASFERVLTPMVMATVADFQICDVGSLRPSAIVIPNIVDPHVVITPGEHGELVFSAPSGGSDGAYLTIGYPRLDFHAATKKYVDIANRTHVHPRYLEKEALETMQAMLTPAAAIDLIQAAYSRVFIKNTESIVWNHGLGTEYVLLQVRTLKAGVWVDDQAEMSYVVIDSNTVRLTNTSGGDIQGADIMGVAFSVPTVRVISITDTFAVDAFGESVETLVTV